MIGTVTASLQNLECCNWIHSQVFSLQEKLCELCSTDCKVYSLVIFGRVLQAAAVTALVGSIAFTFTAGPVALFGLIASVVMGALGTYLAGSKEQIQEIIEMASPFIPGQPVGLRNSGNNCWLNSGLQMLANIPFLAGRMRQIPEFVSFLNAYKAAEDGNYKIADIDTHLIRQILSRETSSQVEQGHVQEDAALLFECLFQGRNSLHVFDRQLNGSPAATSNEPLMQLDIERGSTLLSFEQTLNHFFDHPTDLGQRLQLFFQRPPSDLLIKFNRFYRDRDGTTGKINDSIDVPARLQLPNRFVRSGENSNYECDAFLCHNGLELNSGHYAAYIKKENVWWYCSDASVFAISRERAENAMRQSYILHFAKI